MIRKVILLIIIIVRSFNTAVVASCNNTDGESTETADSLVMKCVSSLLQYRNRMDSIEAETYIYGTTDIIKKNLLLNPLRRFIFIGNKPKNGYFEAFGDVMYFSPGYYTFEPKAFNGDINLYSTQIPEYLYSDIFASRSMDGEYISPISVESYKYYRYTLNERSCDTLAVIDFKPKNNSRLTNGSIDIDRVNFKIKRIFINGRTSFATFKMEQHFHDNRKMNCLPTRIRLEISHILMGNKIRQEIESSIIYKEICFKEKQISVKKSHTHRTKYLTTIADSVKLITDTLFWTKIRSGKGPYCIESKDTVRKNRKAILPEKIRNEFKKGYSAFHKTLGSPQYWEMGNTNFHYSGLIIPSLFSYSGTNGFIYTQRVNISHIFKNGDMLYIRPEAEYQSKYKRFLYKLSCGYEYTPLRLGTSSVNLGKDNAHYSFPHPEHPDEKQNFSLKYIELKNSIELFNGFLLKNMILFQKWENGEFNTRDIIPGLTIYYTPEQYYWINGKQKEYLYSLFPTSSITLLYSIPGKGCMSSRYIQVETEIFQSVSIDAAYNFSYYFGMGKKWDKGYYRPAHFSAFSTRNPSSMWIEKNGNLFYNLPHSFYLLPDSYIQAQIKIRGELILLSKIRNPLSRYIFSEQLFFNQLVTKEIKSYTEIGYGVMNELLDITFIASFERLKYKNFGVKVKFNLMH